MKTRIIPCVCCDHKPDAGDSVYYGMPQLKITGNMEYFEIFCPKCGRASIEFYDDDGDPQYYCMGWMDMASKEIFETCRNCPDFVDRANEEIEEVNARNE